MYSRVDLGGGKGVHPNLFGKKLHIYKVFFIFNVYI